MILQRDARKGVNKIQVLEPSVPQITMNSDNDIEYQNDNFVNKNRAY